MIESKGFMLHKIPLDIPGRCAIMNQALKDSGQINQKENKMFTQEAEVKVKDSSGKVVGTQKYMKKIFHGTSEENGKIVGGEPANLLREAIEFLQSEVGEKGNGVIELLSNVTYAYDLGVRAGIRQSLVSAIAGPDKAIEKQIKDYMAARAAVNKPVTEEVARQRVMQMLEME